VEASLWAVSFFTLIEIFFYVYNKFLLINNDLSADVGYAQKGGSDCRDVSSVPVESLTHLWSRAKSQHSIMIEMKV
jgi:hypothetical protein